MVTLQDRILLLFDDAHPAMIRTGIARAPGLPHEEVRDEIRRMARKSLGHMTNHRGKIGVTITPEGEGARDVFVDSFLNKTRHASEAALHPGSALFSAR